MSKADALRRAVRGRDGSLCWTMRIMGLLLAASGWFLMNQDIFSSPISKGFFMTCAALGAVTVVTSFITTRQKLRIYESTVMQPVVQQRLPERWRTK